MQIHMLNEETINQIAAGEVIIRPVSVVKELVENAIDAGSSRIRVAISQGGTKRIVISDDGCGIPWNEVQLAFERHATSKLTTIDDLQEVATLGFRGEALSSIIAVSKVVVTTRYREEEIGSQVFFEGGKCINQRVCGHDRGTVMDVSDLFYNVPARQKQMNKVKAEGALVRDMVEKLALSHPEIAFTYISDEKKQFATPGNGDLKSALEGVWGRGIVRDMLPLSSDNPPMVLKGYIGGLNAMRGTRDLQIFFINGRYVKNPGLSKAFEEAYEGYLMQHRHPVGIIFMTLPGRLVDVNMHPAKTEIGLLNQSLVYLLFKQGIRDALRAGDLTVSVGNDAGDGDHPISEKGSAFNDGMLLSTDHSDAIHGSSDDAELWEKDQKSDQVEIEESADCESKAGPAHQGSVLSEIVSESLKSYGDEKESIAETEEKTVRNHFRQGQPKIDFSHAKIVGQLFATYILLEQKDEVFLIDQHAAHEAFMYEELRQRFEEKGEFPSQRLLVPRHVQVPVRLISEWDQWASVFKRNGFDGDVFGEDTLIIRSVPVILGEPQPVSLIQTVIDHELYNGDEDRSLQIQRIITMSCKSAVKANQILTEAEIRMLLKGLMALENPFTCPHGRPIILKAKAYDLEKLFKRVV